MHHRIYVPQSLPVGEEIAVTGDEFHHAAHVARVREGEEVELFDGRGGAARGRVIALERDRLRVRIEGDVPSRESSAEIRLAMAVIQLDKFELVLQKATELGVRSFTPLVTERVEVRPERYRGKHERWEKIIFEAVKQSGRALIPTIEPSTRFEEVVARAGMKILFDADHDADALSHPIASATLLVGPEGGWSDEELQLARRAGCVFQRLGPRRLRAETAAIVAAARYSDI